MRTIREIIEFFASDIRGEGFSKRDIVIYYAIVLPLEFVLTLLVAGFIYNL